MTEKSIGMGRIAAMVPVKDIARAQAFYSSLFGLEKCFENGSPVGFMILKGGQGELHLTLQPHYQAAPFNIAHMLVDDVELLFSRCQQQGVRIIKRLQDKDYGLKAFVFADPDGNRIDVGQPLRKSESAS